MEFRYFEAGTDEMSGFVATAGTCDVCGEEVAEGFDLTLSQVSGAPEGAAFGCATCLGAGRFGFEHVTDVGVVLRGGLVHYGADEDDEPRRVFVGLPSGAPSEAPLPAAPPPKPKPSRERVEALRRTPDFPTWNEVAWPLCCDDFMVYLGPLSRERIAELAGKRGRTPEALFADLVGPDFRDLLPYVSTDGDLSCHGFRCRHCSGLEGRIDQS